MSDFESSFYTSSECGSSGNEADSEGEETTVQKEIDKITEKFKHFDPYLYEPEKVVSSTSSSDESDSSSNSLTIDSVSRVCNREWCTCHECKEEAREIDCLCCQEVAALNFFLTMVELNVSLNHLSSQRSA